MNLKRAKALRRIARARTAGRSATAYRNVPRGKGAKVTIVDPACTRGVYLALKKRGKA